MIILAKYISFAWQAIIIGGLVYISFQKNIGLALAIALLYFSVFSGLTYMNEKLGLKNALQKGRSIEHIDKLNGNDFERYLEALFNKFNYDVTRTPASGDFGADLILKNKDQKIVVQAKRYSGNVGVKAVQEVQSARSYYNADAAWVITNSYFTKQAQALAKSCNVKLIERDQLLKIIRKTEKTNEKPSKIS